jgi:hypothetical protein
MATDSKRVTVNVPAKLASAVDAIIAEEVGWDWPTLVIVLLEGFVKRRRQGDAAIQATGRYRKVGTSMVKVIEGGGKRRKEPSR